MSIRHRNFLNHTLIAQHPHEQFAEGADVSRKMGLLQATLGGESWGWFWAGRSRPWALFCSHCAQMAIARSSYSSRSRGVEVGQNPGQYLWGLSRILVLRPHPYMSMCVGR